MRAPSILIAVAIASPAYADIELGATTGLHVFDAHNALGVPETAEASSQRNGPLLGLRIGWFYTHRKIDQWYSSIVGAEAELGLVPSETRDHGVGVVTGTYRAHVFAQFRTWDPAARLFPFALLGGGVLEVLSSKNEQVIRLDRDGVVYAGGGAKYLLPGDWGVRTDARIAFGPSSGTGYARDYELLVSVYKHLGRRPGSCAF